MHQHLFCEFSCMVQFEQRLWDYSFLLYVFWSFHKIFKSIFCCWFFCCLLDGISYKEICPSYHKSLKHQCIVYFVLLGMYFLSCVFPYNVVSIHFFFFSPSFLYFFICKKYNCFFVNVHYFVSHTKLHMQWWGIYIVSINIVKNFCTFHDFYFIPLFCCLWYVTPFLCIKLWIFNCVNTVILNGCFILFGLLHKQIRTKVR